MTTMMILTGLAASAGMFWFAVKVFVAYRATRTRVLIAAAICLTAGATLIASDVFGWLLAGVHLAFLIIPASAFLFAGFLCLRVQQLRTTQGD